jgi:hypothetical protein
VVKAKHTSKRPTRKEKIAKAKAEAEAVFLEYNENTSWAHDKVRSGTLALTPEEVAYMRTEIARRKDIAAHEEEVRKQNDALDLAANIKANAEQT